jgi:23S rRNA (adenine-N6)-dimethyltransferase
MRQSLQRTRSIRYSQNFFKNYGVAQKLVKESSITSLDTVVEIGPGYGTITKALMARAGKVIALEKDKKMYELLKEKYKNNPKIQVVHADYLHYTVREKPYKIFSNIPFSISSQVIKKICFSHHPPTDAYLFTQREAAERFGGKHHEYELSAMTKPWFDYRIVYRFQSDDFSPVPSIEVVLLSIHQKAKPLLPQDKAPLYRSFVIYTFRQQKKDAYLALKDIFTYEQWKRLAHNLHFPIRIGITELQLTHWVGLFTYIDQHVLESKKRRLGRAY